MDRINNGENDVIDIKEILAILKKRALIIFAFTLIAILASGVYSYYFVVPFYQADAVLMVTQAVPDNRSNKGDGMEGLVNSITKLPEMTINTYVAQLKSEAVMDRVVRELKLDKEGYTARGLLGNLAVEAVKDTNLIKLTVVNTNPLLVTQIANTISNEFLNFISETNEQQIGKSIDFLSKQAVAAREEFNKAAATVNNLEAQPRGVALLEKLVAAKTEDFSTYQSLALKARIEYQQLLAGKTQAEQQLNNTSPVNQVLKYDSAQKGYIVVEEINPAYTELNSMLNEKTVLLAEKDAEVNSLKGIIQQLESELRSLQSELGKKKISLQMAQNEVNRLEETNSLLQNKIDETNISRSIKYGETNLVVLSSASIPGGPIKPNQVRNMALAGLMGLLVSIGLAFLLNYLDNTVKTPEDVEQVFDLPILGQIPVHNPDKPSVAGR